MTKKIKETIAFMVVILVVLFLGFLLGVSFERHRTIQPEQSWINTGDCWNEPRINKTILEDCNIMKSENTTFVAIITDFNEKHWDFPEYCKGSKDKIFYTIQVCKQSLGSCDEIGCADGNSTCYIICFKRLSNDGEFFNKDILLACRKECCARTKLSCTKCRNSLTKESMEC